MLTVEPNRPIASYPMIPQILDQPVRPARHIARPSCYVLRTCLQKNRSNNSHTNTHKHTHTKQTHIAHIQLAGRYTIEKLISNPSVQYSSPLSFFHLYTFLFPLPPFYCFSYPPPSIKQNITVLCLLNFVWGQIPPECIARRFQCPDPYTEWE